MNKGRLLAGLLGTALVASIVSVAAPASAADPVPPWETGNTLFTSATNFPNLDPNSKGGLIFYDTTGAVITGGSDLTHIADFISTTGTHARTGADTANVIFATPDHTKANSQLWSTKQTAGSQFFPLANPAPSNLVALGATVPVASLGVNEGNLIDHLASATLDSTAGYANLIQVRVKDGDYTGPTGGVNGAAYFWSVDIEYNNGTSNLTDGLQPGHWRVYYPAVAAPTQIDTSVTAPTPSVASPITVGASITLSSTAAAVSGGTAHPAGTIQFKDGATDVGSAVAVDASGIATTPSFAPTQGSHSYTAVFTPTDTATFNVSPASSALSYVVNASSAIATTATTPTPSTASPITVGASITLSSTAAAVSGGTAHPAGTIQFKDGATNVGSAVAVDASGVATLASFAPTQGSHSYTAVFTPTDTATFNVSPASGTLTFVVNAVSAVPDDTTIALTASPAGTATTSDVLTLAAHVTDTTNTGTPVAVGTVTIKADGADVGSGTVDATGHFSVAFAVGEMLSLGTHSFTADYAANATFNAPAQASVAGFVVTLAAPSNSIAPSAGAARVGAASTCNPGTWQAAFAFTYSWLQRPNPASAWVSLATTRTTPVLSAALAGHQLKCVVTGHNPTGTAAESAPVVIGLGVAPRATKAPKITGTPKVGRTLVAYKGVWNAPITKYLYVWKIGSKVVSRAATFKPTKAQKGKYVVLTVSAVRTGYLTGSASSGRVRIG